jgi:hypothetical protein
MDLIESAFQTMSARDMCFASVFSAWAELGIGNAFCIMALVWV